MFFAEIHQAVEAAVGFVGASEAQKRHTLIENLVGLCIIVVEGRGRLHGAECGGLVVAAGFFGVACGGIGLAQEEVEIVVLCAFEFSLAEVVGIYQTFLEQTDCLGVVALGQGLLCKLHAGELILAGDLSLATFPGVEDAVVNSSTASA